MVRRSELFPVEWYEKIDEMVLKFQNGDKNAAEEILVAFKPYLNKFFNIIREGKINIKDKDSRLFMLHFMPYEETIYKSMRKQSPSYVAKVEAKRCLDGLKFQCRYLTDEDLNQELITSMLVLAKRYKKTNRNFAAYIYNAFRHEIARRIKAIMKDPSVYNGWDYNYSYNDYENVSEEICEQNEVVDREYADVPGDELSSNWIHGSTCSDIFFDLTPFERLILKLRYIDFITDIEIGKRTGYHRNWISIRRRRAIEKIKRKLDEQS